ncbi:APC amino acid permease [Trametopsis cervina]|nr:APC amino acid permease [Trametopsis cervina]
MPTPQPSSSQGEYNDDHDAEIVSASREDEPLLGSRTRRSDSGLEDATKDGEDGHLVETTRVRVYGLGDDPPKNSEKRQLGLASAVFLIFNRVIGTGIFATPSMILRSSGSVGMSLVMWLLGATVAACGTAVFVELGTGLPRNGGEKNYLEFIYRRPRFLAITVYATFAILNGWEAATSNVFGEYVLHTIDPEHPASPAATRVASMCCITVAFLLHGTNLKWGLRVQNALGATKLFILVGIALTGLGVLVQAPGFHLEHRPHNLRWSTMWEGSGSGGANAFVTGLYSVIWSFIGYSNANYALSEIRDPIRTIKLAAPLAMFSITIVYMLVNIAYYAVVDKQEILGSGRIIAALFFGKVWGIWTERVLSTIVAISCMGNVLAVLFSQGRVIQELGREGVIPFSSFFASNKPFDAPLAGLFAQWVMTGILVTSVPPGDAYQFMLNSSSYPGAIINTLVSGGLLALHSTGLAKAYDWNPPFKAYYPVVVFFFLSNIFLLIMPLVPPALGRGPYEHLPYWLHVFTGLGIVSIGLVYWFVVYKWLPRRGGYKIVRERVIHEDGVARGVLKKVPVL